jgi:hypothetical protein
VSATAVLSPYEYAARLFEPKPRLYPSPLTLARHIDPRTGVSAALNIIDQALVDLVNTDEHDALLVTIPPQEGKSQLCSRRFPEWVLTDRPELPVTIVSYEAEVALRWVRDIKLDIELAGPDLPVTIRPDSSAAGRWETPEGGGDVLYWRRRAADRPPVVDHDRRRSSAAWPTRCPRAPATPSPTWPSRSSRSATTGPTSGS